MTTAPVPVVRLREDAYARWAARKGLDSDMAAAELIGVSQPTLSRVRRGETAPGEKFIAALLAATGRKFEAMFEVVT